MLEPTVKKKLLAIYQALNSDGKLLSRTLLDQYYTTFRTRFGPDKLANLDGEALLTTIHGPSPDCLAHWLEWGNEEFPASFGGGIAGGSAFKYGINCRRETRKWEVADGKTIKHISLEEAIGIARNQRDELLRGVEALQLVPSNAGDEEYRLLQQRLEKEAPHVSEVMWGHKFFYLLYPDKLDEIHTPEWQRFLLCKMLQKPPEGEGRYVCAGRFVAAALELELPMNHLVQAIWSLSEGKHHYWRVGTSDGKTPRNHWPLMRDGNCVAVGWPELKDLSSLEDDKESQERLQQLLAEKYPSAPPAIGKARKQIFQFVLRMSKGDVVLAADGGTVLGIGRITGSYHFDADSDFPHRRPVQWLSHDEWKMPEPEGLQTTVHEVKKHVSNILEVERRVQSAPPLALPITTPQIAGEPGQRHIPRLKGVRGQIQAVLERKSQVILYGPPGTGKTFWAKKAALDLAAYYAFGRAFDDLGESEKREVDGGETTGGLVRLCCFHPAYGYEDFIEGYRPRELHGQLVFHLRDGVFKRLAKDAQQARGRHFFLIVDEINRGDIPRIFGELLTVLETDKRDKETILLPVSGEPFRVPPNIFLIGTMNTADRSISLLDAALRRRFGFVELMPDTTILKGHVVNSIPLAAWLLALNRRICNHVGRDARNLQIGHSYLLQKERPLKDLAAFKHALRDDILPLLEEYCYSDFLALQNILGKGMLDIENKRIRHELFDEGQEEQLVQALLGPDILTFPDALTTATEAEEESAEDEEDEEGVNP